MRVAVLLVLVAALGGCASASAPYWTKDDYVRPKTIVVHETVNMRVWCNQYPNAFACVPHRQTDVCAIFVRKGFLSASRLEHERCHCLGYGHAIGAVGAHASPACPESAEGIKIEKGIDL